MIITPMTIIRTPAIPDAVIAVIAVMAVIMNTIIITCDFLRHTGIIMQKANLRPLPMSG
jgi:hypothetical protein